MDCIFFWAVFCASKLRWRDGAVFVRPESSGSVSSAANSFGQRSHQNLWSQRDKGAPWWKIPSTLRRFGLYPIYPYVYIYILDIYIYLYVYWIFQMNFFFQRPVRKELLLVEELGCTAASTTAEYHEPSSVMHWLSFLISDWCKHELLLRCTVPEWSNYPLVV